MSRQNLLITLFAVVCVTVLGWLVYQDSQNRLLMYNMVHMQGVIKGQSTGFTMGYIEGYEKGSKKFLFPGPTQKPLI
jgi:hypothetical protein